MSKWATSFITATASIGMLVLAHSLWYWQSADLARFLCYLLIATLASGLKIQLPGIDGTMSVNFLFILLGVLEMSLPETLVIGCTAGLAQCIWSAGRKADPAKVLFNVFMMANAIALSYFVFYRLERVLGESTPLLLVVTALVFFLANTLPVSVIICLTEGKSPRKVWSECIAFCPQDGLDVERLLAEADRRMYSMKQIHHAEPAAEAALPPSRSRGASVN